MEEKTAQVDEQFKEINDKIYIARQELVRLYDLRDEILCNEVFLSKANGIEVI